MKGFSHAKGQAESLCLLCKELKISSPMRILDLSCGIGGHSIFLAGMGHKLVGYDPSEFYIKKPETLPNDNWELITILDSSLEVCLMLTDILLKEGECNFDLIINMGQSIRIRKYLR